MSVINPPRGCPAEPEPGERPPLPNMLTTRTMPKPGLPRFPWQLPLAGRGPVLVHHADGNVDVLKDFPGGNPPRAIGGFHEVIPWLTVMFAAECVHERE